MLGVSHGYVLADIGTGIMSNFGKKLIFIVLSVMLVVAAVELMNQILFFGMHGKFVWSGVERFNVRSFTKRVDDARFVTMKPNIKVRVDEGWGVPPWSLATDKWGFRKGAHATVPDCSNVVFIGASVPFGWGVADRQTLPSRVFDRLRTDGDQRCVINAAIPSSSLFQAIARYDIEIHGKFKVDTVFLQIYDPVSQLLLLGPRWRPDANWTTEPKIEFDYSLPLLKRCISAAA